MRRVARMGAIGGMVAAAALAAVPAAQAGKPAGGSSSLTLVLVNSTDGLPHYGQTINWSVSTTQTDRPYVRVNCQQGGQTVYTASAGYFAGYPWSTDMVLSSQTWTGGDADCSAQLYSTKDGTRITVLATQTFHVYA